MAQMSPARNQAARKTALAAAIDGLAPEWKEISLRIHANPELSLKEEKASAWLAEALGRGGVSVERNVAKLRTAFVARAGGPAARPSIAFLAEYDALPGLGHACSHNLIGSAACLAGIALARALRPDEALVQVIGCPAEEFYGGKAQLLQHGVFKGVDAALMAHGYYLNLGMRPSIGRASLILEFFGRPAHASSAPETGVNALDAMIQTFNNVALLRQQVRSEARIHGIITHGGAAANVIPDYTRAEFFVRSADGSYVQELRRRVIACARGAATATGTRLKVSADGHVFEPIRPNTTLARAYEENLRFIGQRVDTLPGESGYGSTDFGNVSQAVPALHAYFRITDAEIRPHSTAFGEACRTPQALDGMVQAAKAMALTALDLVHSPKLLQAAKEEWSRAAGD
jgi:amidohydrolase